MPSPQTPQVKVVLLAHELLGSLVALVLTGVAVFAGRWPAVAVTASVLAGALAAVAILLPNVPNFDVAFPESSLDTIGRSYTTMSEQLGVAGAVLLLAVWVYAACGWRNSVERVAAGVRGALLAALMLCLIGAMPMRPTGRWWIVGLALLLGVAVTSDVSVSRRQKQRDS